MSLHACSNTIAQNDLLSSPEKQNQNKNNNKNKLKKFWAIQHDAHKQGFCSASIMLAEYIKILGILTVFQ